MSRKQTRTDVPERRSISLFSRDDRGIEGLPIRLVIAIVIGVAALTIMMTMMDGLDQFNEEEITIDFESDDASVIEEGEDFSVKVVDENGNGVEGAQVVAKEGTARIEESGSATVEETNGDGVAEFTLTTELPQGQETGTVEFEINSPSDSSYTEAEDHDTLTVVQTDS